MHPPTTVLERHVNNAEDLKALDDQVKQYENTKPRRLHRPFIFAEQQEYLEPEHFIMDKGSIIKENVHHHIHHIVQPVFEKDSEPNRALHLSSM
ncbi:hypothetical protein C0992_000475 [Termitomyces sp. T32_za158]|nr:hypothetical protein C0992_000475 [Termitomyces sp. T32_za158]